MIDSGAKLYIIKHGFIDQAEIIKKCERRYTCVLCRRMMFRIASAIAKIEKADFLITGENLGQVASQTLDNLVVVTDVVKIPILRPLLTYDKQEIMDLAKEIGTYDLSILPSNNCSAVPNKPATSAKLDKILEEEKKINIKNLIDKAADGLEEIII